MDDKTLDAMVRVQTRASMRSRPNCRSSWARPKNH